MKLKTENDTNMKIYTIALIAGLGLAMNPAVHAQGCCSGSTDKQASGCPMGGMNATCTRASLTADSTSKPVFSGPVQTVYDNYFKVQQALVRDSIDGVANAASAMAKAIQNDGSKHLSSKVAQEAEALAKAKDLTAAREQYKKLSDSLIQYLKDQKLQASGYEVVYCPMAKASWLQLGKMIMNPYMGKAMAHCGEIKS